MPDFTKHFNRAREAINDENYDLAIELCLECLELEAAESTACQLLIQASIKRARRVHLPTLDMGILSRDPHRKLQRAYVRVSRQPNVDNLMAVAHFARLIYDAKKALRVPSEDLSAWCYLHVVIMFYEAANDIGLSNPELLWGLGHAYHERFDFEKEVEDIELAIARLQDLERSHPQHLDAKRVLNNWQAERSIFIRQQKQKAHAQADFTSQLVDGQLPE